MLLRFLKHSAYVVRGPRSNGYAGKSQGPTPCAAPLPAFAMPLCAACRGKVKGSPAPGVFPGTSRLATWFNHTAGSGKRTWYVFPPRY